MGSPASLITDPFHPANVVRDAYPSEKGHLVILPTKVELQYSCQTIEVFVVTIPLKSASTVLRYVHGKARCII